jgi:hypothetical protein
MTKMNASSPDSVLALNPHIAQYSFVGPYAERVLDQHDRLVPVHQDLARERRPAPQERCRQAVLGRDVRLRASARRGGSGKLETVRCVNVFSHQLLLSQLKPANRRDL